MKYVLTKAPVCIPIAPMRKAGSSGSQYNQNILDVILIPSTLYAETIEKQGFFQKSVLTAK